MGAQNAPALQFVDEWRLRWAYPQSTMCTCCRHHRTMPTQLGMAHSSIRPRRSFQDRMRALRPKTMPPTKPHSPSPASTRK